MSTPEPLWSAMPYAAAPMWIATAIPSEVWNHDGSRSSEVSRSRAASAAARSPAGSEGRAFILAMLESMARTFQVGKYG